MLFAPDSPGQSSIPDLDKVVHTLLFLALSATTWWRFAGNYLGLVAVIAYGAVSELIQHVTLSGRDGDVRDFTADAAGALFGWVIARRLSARVTSARRTP